MKVYLNIENLLNKNGKSKYWLVKELDSNYTAVNKMIKHQSRAIRFETIEQLLEIFDCSIDELFIVKNEKDYNTMR